MICPGRVTYASPMKSVTTLRVGGPADALVAPISTEEVVKVMKWAHRTEVPLTLMGRGSNLLVQDKGIRGVVVRIGPQMGRWNVEDEDGVIRLRTQAGLPLRRLMRESISRGWGGIEFLVGIPGFLGGAIAMNAGTPEGCIGDAVQEIVLVRPDGEVKRRRACDLSFTYRKLDIPDGSAIVEAVLRLQRKAPQEIRKALHHRMLERRSTQPLEISNAGSVFKNPQGDFAGRIIEEMGLKGLARGGAQISSRHANFILNTGGAKARDLIALIDEVRVRVLRERGVQLELEIQVVGEAT
jgi:UDP-N-acetylmuramate dehydrogenase